MKALLFIRTACTAEVLAGPQSYPLHAQVVHVKKPPYSAKSAEAESVVWVENFSNLHGGVEIDTKRTVVLRSVGTHNIKSSPRGEGGAVFLEELGETTSASANNASGRGSSTSRTKAHTSRTTAADERKSSATSATPPPQASSRRCS